jgi:hypothetical protein
MEHSLLGVVGPTVVVDLSVFLSFTKTKRGFTLIAVLEVLVGGMVDVLVFIKLNDVRRRWLLTSVSFVLWNRNAVWLVTKVELFDLLA